MLYILICIYIYVIYNICIYIYILVVIHIISSHISNHTSSNFLTGNSGEAIQLWQNKYQNNRPIHGFQFQLIPASDFSHKSLHHSHLHFAAELTAPDLKISKLRFHRAHSLAGAIKICHLRSGIRISFDKSKLRTASAGHLGNSWHPMGPIGFHWVPLIHEPALRSASYQPAILILAASKGQAKGSLLPRPRPTTLPSHLQMGNIPQTANHGRHNVSTGHKIFSESIGKMKDMKDMKVLHGIAMYIMYIWRLHLSGLVRETELAWTIHPIFILDFPLGHCF